MVTRITNQAGFKKRIDTGDGMAWEYLITVEAWREIAAGAGLGAWCSQICLQIAVISFGGATARILGTRKFPGTARGASTMFGILFSGAIKMVEFADCD